MLGKQSFELSCFDQANPIDAGQLARTGRESLVRHTDKTEVDAGIFAFVQRTRPRNEKLRPIEIAALSFEPRCTFVPFEDIVNLGQVVD